MNTDESHPTTTATGNDGQTGDRTTVEGTILVGPDLEAMEGHVVLEDGEIVAVERNATDSDAIVCPAFVNAHTHVADAIVKEAGRGLDLEALVAPPDGLKHRRLREADREDLVRGIRRSARYMRRGGTTVFADFREGGVEGVEIFREAVAGTGIRGLAFGREDPDVLSIADGFGASGAADADFTAERQAARDAGKPFFIHAGEAGPEDVEPALALDPDCLIHMVHATDDHLDTLADLELPVVVCPRSNLVTGAGLPPVAALDRHTTVGLGTDNVMLNSPSMFREMAYTSKLTDCDAPQILRMATVNGGAILDLDVGVIEPDRPADLVVLDGDSDNLSGYEDVYRAIVRRAGVADVQTVYTSG
jgi:cytosine/adenosine deaminase-related metal-dependent hydrolase